MEFVFSPSGMIEDGMLGLNERASIEDRLSVIFICTVVDTFDDERDRVERVIHHLHSNRATVSPLQCDYLQ